MTFEQFSFSIIQTLNHKIPFVTIVYLMKKIHKMAVGSQIIKIFIYILCMYTQYIIEAREAVTTT